MLLEEMILYGALTVMWTEFLWEFYLSIRQHRVYVKTEKVPLELKDILDESTFQKSRLYAIDKSRFSMIKECYAVVTATLVMCYYVLFHLWSTSQRILTTYSLGNGEIMTTALFMILMNTFNTVISLPLKIYDTFVLEEKHGFNKQTVGFFIKDKIKAYIVVLILLTPISCGAVYIVKAGGDYFFLYLWLFATGMVLFLMTIYSDYIAPLFDKYTPLPEGELRTEIEKLASSLNFPLYKLYLVEGSKRSVHSNAYFYGFFKNKRIVLFDTLLKNEKNGDKGCDNDEIVAVLSHELGHWQYNHVFYNLVIMQVNLFLQFAAFALLFKYSQLYSAFGFRKEQPVIIGLIVIMQFVFAPYNSVMSYFMTVLSRKFEFQADAFAKGLGKANHLKKALIKLHLDNLSFPVYDWLYSSWHHSHPPLLQRLDAMNKDKKRD